MLMSPEIRETGKKDDWGPSALTKRRERTAHRLARLAQKREYWIGS
jgi:hypothetical protein